MTTTLNITAAKESDEVSLQITSDMPVTLVMTELQKYLENGYVIKAGYDTKVRA